MGPPACRFPLTSASARLILVDYEVAVIESGKTKPRYCCIDRNGETTWEETTVTGRDGIRRGLYGVVARLTETQRDAACAEAQTAGMAPIVSEVQ